MSYLYWNKLSPSRSSAQLNISNEALAFKSLLLLPRTFLRLVWVSKWQLSRGIRVKCFNRKAVSVSSCSHDSQQWVILVSPGKNETLNGHWRVCLSKRCICQWEETSTVFGWDDLYHLYQNLLSLGNSVRKQPRHRHQGLAFISTLEISALFHVPAEAPGGRLLRLQASSR